MLPKAEETAMKKSLLTINELKEYLNFSRGTIYNLINTGQLKAINVRAGRKLLKRFRPEDVELYLQQSGLQEPVREITDDNTED